MVGGGNFKAKFVQVMEKSQSLNYESPQTAVIEAFAEGVLCQSTTESLGENQGSWGELD